MIRVNIDKILEQKNKTAFWLSKETKIGYNNLKKLVDNNTNAIKFENLETICDVLEVNLSDVLEIIKEDEKGS
ncbi:helix-turn-helix transcriptional regulator [Clostridium sp. 19966]|uniref:helix-turn-helix domain-containing protein n=1 Tax=Clostridium sp. 19966 TaxID=2768166 RepID=UPI0028E993B4|nr:helix-turn-helix transcriptional regulator [Clostridium sp. 19966]